MDAPVVGSDNSGRVELDARKLGQWGPHALLCAQSQAWRLRGR